MVQVYCLPLRFMVTDMVKKDKSRMGKAIVKCKIATYAEDEYVVEVPCEKDEVDEIIIARAWKMLKEEEEALPYGNRTAEILKKMLPD